MKGLYMKIIDVDYNIKIYILKVILQQLYPKNYITIVITKNIKI